MTETPHSRIGSYRQWWRPAFALLIIAVVYFYRIDSPLLWDDEADTGIEARHVLRYGYPRAYDDRNVSVFVNGSGFNKNLVCNKVPWSEFYVGALSIKIFGDNTTGLRILFAFCGVLSFFPIYAILRSRLRYPSVMTVLTLIAPQIVLLQRNARYYPLLILLYAVLVWHLLRNFKSPRNHFILASLIFVLFFHTHAFAAVCSCFSLLAFCLFFRREVLLSYFFACCIGFASWYVWYEILGPSLGETALPILLFAGHFSAWFQLCCTSILTTVVSMDVVGCFPILLWAALLAVLLIRNRNVLRNLFRERLYAFVFLNILIQTVANAALFGDDPEGYSHLRYAPHLLVFGLVVLFMVLNAVIASGRLYLFVGMVAVASNLLTMSFWAKPFSGSAPVSWLFPAGFWLNSPRNNSGRVPVSWAFPVYTEIFKAQKNACALAISLLESASKNESGRDSVVASLPYWTQNVAIYYLGDRYLIRPILRKPGDVECAQALRKIMDKQALDKLFAQPEWILDVLDVTSNTPDGYDLAFIVHSHQIRPDDGARPELTCHDFPQSAVIRNVRLFLLHKK